MLNLIKSWVLVLHFQFWGNFVVASQTMIFFLGMSTCYLWLVPFLIMVLLFPTVRILRDVLYVFAFYLIFSTASYTEKVFNRYLSIGIEGFLDLLLFFAILMSKCRLMPHVFFKKEIWKPIWVHLILQGGLPGWLSGKESACQCRRCGFDAWVKKIPWRRKWQHAPIFLPGKSMDRGAWWGYSPWGCKESGMT